METHRLYRDRAPQAPHQPATLQTEMKGAAGSGRAAGGERSVVSGCCVLIGRLALFGVNLFNIIFGEMIISLVLHLVESLGGFICGCLCSQSGGLGVLKRFEVSKVLAAVHGSPRAVLFASGFFAYSSECVIHLL